MGDVGAVSLQFTCVKKLLSRITEPCVPHDRVAGRTRFGEAPVKSPLFLEFSPVESLGEENAFSYEALTPHTAKP